MQAGQFTYRIKDIDLKDVKKFYDRSPSAEAAQELYGKFCSSQNHILPFQAEFASHDLLNGLPAKDLKSTLKIASEVLDSKQRSIFDFNPVCGDFVAALDKNPKTLEKIESELAKGGLTNFRYLGFGKTGICLEAEMQTGKKVAVMLRKGVLANLKRMPIPHHLQPLHSFQADGFHVEVTPKINSKAASVDHLHELKTAIACHTDMHGGKYAVSDSVVRNIGLSEHGTSYYLDGDGIDKVASGGGKPAMPSNPDLRWVESDGTWKQYKEFEAEHKMFNSPLHQSGGKIIPAAEMAETKTPSAQPIVKTTPAAAPPPIAPMTSVESPHIKPAVPLPVETAHVSQSPPPIPPRPAAPHVPNSPHVNSMAAVESNVERNVEQAGQKVVKAAKGMGKGSKIAIGVAAAGAALLAGWAWLKSKETPKEDNSNRQEKSAPVQNTNFAAHPADSTNRSWTATVDASRSNLERSL